MIGIKSIASYIPDHRIDNKDRIEKFDIDISFLKNKTGMLRLARKSSNESTSDLCCSAVNALIIKEKLEKKIIDCLVVCTQNPDGKGLPHTSAIVHGKLELSTECAVFDISLGCSGYVYGLSILKGFMQVNGYKNAILVTADPYSEIIDEDDKNTSLLFGDAATATLLSDEARWDIGKFCFGSEGRYCQAIKVNVDQGYLEMNGRSVFNFTATVIPKNIEAVLAVNGFESKDIDKYLFHQASKYIIDTLSKRLNIDPEKVPFMAEDYGNTVSSSIPLMLEMFLHTEKTIVISGFGVGLSWGATLLRKL